MSKYVSLDNLERYDGKIKEYIGNAGNVHALSSGVGVSTSTPFILENYKPGIYFLTPSSTNVSSTIYVKGLSSATSYLSFSGSGSSAYINYFKNINEASNNEVIARIFSTRVSSSTAADSKVVEIKKSTSAAAKIVTGSTSSYSLSTSSVVTTTGAQTISGKKTFSILPESSVVPTSNSQLVNKKYVDDAISAGGGGISNYLVLTRNFDVFFADTYGYKYGDYLINLNGYKLVISHQDPSGEITITDDLVNVPSDYVYLKLHSPSSDSSVCSFIQNDGNVQIVYHSGGYNEYQYEIIADNARVRTSGNQTISGVKTFSALPQSSIVPTNNNDLVNKSYVDTSITELTTTVENTVTNNDIDSLFN